MQSATQVPVYNWVNADLTEDGCGTAREFAYWQAEGVIPKDTRLGQIIAYEPASEDARRELAWAA